MRQLNVFQSFKSLCLAGLFCFVANSLSAQLKAYEFNFRASYITYSILLYKEANNGWMGDVVYYTFGRKCHIREYFKAVYFTDGSIELYGHHPEVFCGTSTYYADHFRISKDGYISGGDSQGAIFHVSDLRHVNSIHTFNYLLQNVYTCF